MKIVIEDLEIKIVDLSDKKNNRSYKKQILGKIKNKIYRMINVNIKTKKVIAGFLAALIIFVQSPYSLIIAQTIPAIPETPVAPTPPPEPELNIVQPTTPEAPEVPTTPPTLDELLNPTPTPSPTPKPPKVKPVSTTSDVTSPTTSSPNESNGGNVNSDTNIATGDATTTANSTNTGNTNATSTPSVAVSGASGGVSVANTDNGSGSSNTGSVGIVDNNNTIQDNTAVIGNDLHQVTTTGDNDASRNTGGESSISTGDANTTGTIINSVNSNIAGVGVYEFNIVDDHMGDYVLDLANATCVSGCGTGDVAVSNTGNGTDSENTASADVVQNDNTFQNNDAQLNNNMVLVSESGGNTAEKNTNGDSSIETGDANVSGNIINLVNNNFAGEVVYAVVNVFGNLIGDIILPDGTVLSCCSGSVSAENSGNGADSTNTASVDQATNDNTYQFNNADIENNLVFSATTGDNETSKNTNGNSTIETGDSSIIAQVTNIANLNLLGGNYWLVIVNEAGRWIGKILGTSDNTNYAGSEVFEFLVDEYGQVTVSNSGNGAGSVNNAGVSQETNNTIVQNNNASIVNNVYLSANTGDNSASKNTGGDSSIKTGDANIIANIVNFVNNNIVGSGNLFITFVNVFGSWVGDFVGPGYTKEAKSQAGIGGASDSDNHKSSSSSQSQSGGGYTEEQTYNTEAVKPVSETKSKVLALFADAKSKNDPVDENSSDEKTVFAGLNEDAAAGDRAININLAWLVFTIPFVVVYIIRKKRFTFIRLLPNLNRGNA